MPHVLKVLQSHYSYHGNVKAPVHKPIDKAACSSALSFSLVSNARSLRSRSSCKHVKNQCEQLDSFAYAHMCAHMHTYQVSRIENTGVHHVHEVGGWQPSTIHKLLHSIQQNTYLLPECTDCLVFVQQFLLPLYKPQLLLCQLGPALPVTLCSQTHNSRSLCIKAEGSGNKRYAIPKVQVRHPSRVVGIAA